METEACGGFPARSHAYTQILTLALKIDDVEKRKHTRMLTWTRSKINGNRPLILQPIFSGDEM